MMDKKGFMKRYLSFLHKNRLLAFILGQSITEIIRGFVMTQGIAWGVNWITTGCVEHDIRVFYTGMIVFSSSILFSVVVVYFENLFLKYKFLDVSKMVRTRIVETALLGERSDIREYAKDDLLFRYNNNAGQVVKLYSSIQSFIGSFGKIIGGYAAGFMLSWELTLILILFGIIKLLVDRKIIKPLASMVSESNRKAYALFADVVNFFRGIMFIRMVSNEEKVIDRFGANIEQYTDISGKKNRVGIYIGTIGDMIEIVVLLSVFSIGAAMTAGKMITIGVFAAFISLYDHFVNPYKFVSNFIQSINEYKVGCDKVFDIIENATQQCDTSGMRTDLSVEFSLVIDDLTFGYEENRDILSNFSMRAHSGEVTYIVGKSGIGKSTLFRIISGLYEQQKGKIMVDCHGGERMALEPSMVTTVSQTPFLFNASIAENIALEQEDTIDTTRLEIALRYAGIGEFVSSLPDGTHTRVVDKGKHFSGGQRCRLSLARAFYNVTPVILFDEVYASVDNVTIQTIEESMRELCKRNCCLMFITHRHEWIPPGARRVELG